MTKWFNGLSVAWRLGILALLALAAIVTYNFAHDLLTQDKEIAAEVAEERNDAAIESGQDAVNTVTRIEEKRVERYETVRTIQEEVNNAQDFHSAHTAGADGLCVNFGVCADDQLQQPRP